MAEIVYRLLFKVLRIVKKKWCVAKLDFAGKNIYIVAENWREYSVRAKSCEKEPETTAWLMANCKEGEVLFDIGANIGAYSLVGAALGAKVVAFEPSYSNFNRLNENLSLNGLDKRVQSFPVAFARTRKVGLFKFMDASPGSSACFYNESGEFHSKLKTVEVEKSVLVYNLDSFIKEFQIPQPTLLKIDVDGAELEILEGASDTMSNSVLMSAIIEVDHRIVEKGKFVQLMSGFGFEVTGEYRRGVEEVFNYTFLRK
jgi:FkbM family methyltransferase